MTEKATLLFDGLDFYTKTGLKLEDNKKMTNRSESLKDKKIDAESVRNRVKKKFKAFLKEGAFPF